MNNNKRETAEERCGLASILHEKNQFYTLTICIMSRGGLSGSRQSTHMKQGLKASGGCSISQYNYTQAESLEPY